MNWYDLSAACFITLQLIKFVVGLFAERFDLRFELDAFHEILFCVFFCAVVWSTGNVTGSWVTSAAGAFFAVTLWSAISVFKNSTLLQIYRGRGR